MMTLNTPKHLRLLIIMGSLPRQHAFWTVLTVPTPLSRSAGMHACTRAAWVHVYIASPFAAFPLCGNTGIVIAFSVVMVVTCAIGWASRTESNYASSCLGPDPWRCIHSNTPSLATVSSNRRDHIVHVRYWSISWRQIPWC